MFNVSKIDLTTKLCAILIVLILVVLYKESCKKEYMENSEGTSTMNNIQNTMKKSVLSILGDLTQYVNQS